MTSRFPFRLASILGPFGSTLILALVGCDDGFNGGPMKYVENEKHAAKVQAKPEQQKLVQNALADLFGPEPKHIKVPDGTGLPHAGIHLANYLEDSKGKVQRITMRQTTGGRRVDEAQEGGYALYRKHCLHCHGVSGAGDGPTSAFLYPRPRDYRYGMFKFTSTPTGAKPTREDLRRTIRSGLHGTSMPAFEPLMTDHEIDQVVDYMIFLSERGETEIALLDEVTSAGELTAESIRDVAVSVFNKWKAAEKQVVNPPVAKTPSTPESIQRGRALFLGVNQTGNKVDCTSCHGAQGVGDGPSFVSQDVFNEVVFGGNPSEMDDRLNHEAERVAREEEERSHDPKAGEAAAAKLRESWKNSLDDWGNPFRPANLNRGVYKGGRRPIDLYWRIAKGINGAKMPAHYPTIEAERIWDLVNFILALPYDPSLLEGATLPAGPPASAPKVVNR